jgi:hypothetical protein
VQPTGVERGDPAVRAVDAVEGGEPVEGGRARGDERRHTLAVQLRRRLEQVAVERPVAELAGADADEVDPLLIPGSAAARPELEHLAAGGDACARKATRVQARDRAERVQARQLDEAARHAELAEEHGAERPARGERGEGASDRAVGLGIALARREAERVDAEALLRGGKLGHRTLDGAVAGDQAASLDPDEHRDRGGDAGGDQHRPPRVPAQSRGRHDERRPCPPAKTTVLAPRTPTHHGLGHARTFRLR